MDSATDWIAAISALVTAIFTGALVVFAFTAWRAALDAVNAARDANRATEQAEEQARSDSIEQTRPYVFVEIIPGLHGRGAYDVRVSNSGRSSARELHMTFDNWPEQPDDVAESVGTMMETRRTLPPGCQIRSVWRLTAGENETFSDGTTEVGMPEAGTITVRYRSHEPTAPEYSDTFDVPIATSGVWPVPSSGPRPDGLNGDARKFYKLGQELIRKVGELSR